MPGAAWLGGDIRQRRQSAQIMLAGRVISSGRPNILDASGVTPLGRWSLHRRSSRARDHASPLNLQGRKKNTRDYGAGISGFYREEFTGTKEEDDRVVRHGEVLIVRRIAPDSRG
jgi:hypothetical protein